MPCIQFLHCTSPQQAAGDEMAAVKTQITRKTHNIKKKQHIISVVMAVHAGQLCTLLQPWASLVQGIIKSVCGELWIFCPRARHSVRHVMGGPLSFVPTSGQSGHKWRGEVVVHSSTSPSSAASEPRVCSCSLSLWCSDTPDLVKLSSAAWANEIISFWSTQ